MFTTDIDIGVVPRCIQRRVVVQHRLAPLHLEEFGTTILIFVVQMLLVVSICASASAEDRLLGLPCFDEYMRCYWVFIHKLVAWVKSEEREREERDVIDANVAQ